jgi:hypothetical protein
VRTIFQVLSVLLLILGLPVIALATTALLYSWLAPDQPPPSMNEGPALAGSSVGHYFSRVLPPSSGQSLFALVSTDLARQMTLSGPAFTGDFGECCTPRRVQCWSALGSYRKGGTRCP